MECVTEKAGFLDYLRYTVRSRSRKSACLRCSVHQFLPGAAVPFFMLVKQLFQRWQVFFVDHVDFRLRGVRVFRYFYRCSDYKKRELARTLKVMWNAFRVETTTFIEGSARLSLDYPSLWQTNAAKRTVVELLQKFIGYRAPVWPALSCGRTKQSFSVDAHTMVGIHQLCHRCSVSGWMRKCAVFVQR